ncbi:MAG: hypothetical protein ACI33P_04485 [Lysinibacillus sp.]
MTRWKERIDQELGLQRRFTRQMEERIFQRAETNRRKIDWKTGAAAVGILLVALLLVLIGPSQPERQTRPAENLEQMLARTEVEEFFISALPFHERKFTARGSEFYLLNEKYDGQEDVQFLQSILESANVSEMKRFIDGKDVLINMGNGEQLKLKFYVFEQFAGIGIKDLETGLFYTVEDEDVWDFYYDFQPSGGKWKFYILPLLMAGLNLFVERFLLRRHQLKPVRKFYLKKGYLLTMGVLVVFMLVVGLYVVWSGGMAVHKGWLLVSFLLIHGINYGFERKYTDNPTYQKINRFHYTAMGILTALWVFWL